MIGRFVSTQKNEQKLLIAELLLRLKSDISFNLYFQCYECDGIKGGNTPCDDGGSHPGNTQRCGGGLDKCGLLQEERLTYDAAHVTVVSSETRWRRGCVSDGHELTDGTEAQPGDLTGDLGCVEAGSRTENRVTIRHTLCLCNTTMCNEHKPGNSSATFIPSLMLIIMTIFMFVQL